MRVGRTFAAILKTRGQRRQSRKTEVYRQMLAFLSRVTSEFGCLDEALRGYFGCFPAMDLKTPEQVWCYEGGFGTLEKLRHFLNNADAVVHLVGDEVGATPTRDQVELFLSECATIRDWASGHGLDPLQWSYTQWEFWLAAFRRSCEVGRVGIFVCERKEPTDPLHKVGLPPEAAPTTKSQHESPRAKHLKSLKAVGYHSNIRFDSVAELQLALMKSDFGKLAHGLQQAQLIDLASLAQQMARSAPSRALLDWPQTVGRMHRWLDRPELAELICRIQCSSYSITLVLGDPGSGKSALLARLAKDIGAGFAVVAIKADELPASVTTDYNLATELGLPKDTDVATSIRRLADTGPVLLLIDQLDALGELMVESPARLRLLLRLIHELAGHRRVHIVASCRRFEHQHDPSLRRIEAEELTLEMPSWEAIEKILSEEGQDASAWNQELKETLRSPHALRVFLDILAKNPEAHAAHSFQLMLDELWRQKIDRGPVGIAAALQQVVDEIARCEETQIPRARMGIDAHSLAYLEANGFLLSSGTRVGFRHQTLYEHACVRGFARDPSTFVSSVLARQHNLRVRPLLWHGLVYLREADPTGHANVLDELWRAEDLRDHLRMLLLEFIGQQQEPRHSEKGCVKSALCGTSWRDRTLSVIAKSQAWFRWLVSAMLDDLMASPGASPGALVNVLRIAVGFDPATVIERIERHWVRRPELDVHVGNILVYLKDWTERSMAIARTLIERGSVEPWLLGEIVMRSLSTVPRSGVALVRAWLEVQCRAARPDPVSSSIPASETSAAVVKLLRDTRCYRLPDIASRAPREFSECVFPWFAEAARLASREDAFGLIERYPHRHYFLILGEARTGVGGVAEALDKALTAWGAAEPGVCLQFLQGHMALADELAQRLIARALIPVCATSPEAVLAYLQGDRRRLMLGQEGDFPDDSWKLVGELAERLPLDRRSDLEEILLDWSPYRPGEEADDLETAEQRDLWRRQLRLRLLEAIPESVRSERIRNVISQERTELPPSEEPRPPVRDFQVIGSPIALEAMELMSDAELVAELLQFPDETGWNHPREMLQGGAVQLSREFEQFAAKNPERAARVLEEFVGSAKTPTSYGMYAAATLKAVGGSADTEHCLKLASFLLEAGFGEVADFRTQCAETLEGLARRNVSVPSHLVELLAQWLAPCPIDQWTPEDAHDSDDARAASVLFDGGRMVALPPGGNLPMLRALATIHLTNGDPQRWLAVLEAHVEREEDPLVWCALAAAMRNLGDADVDRAARFLTTLLDRHCGLMDRTLGAHLVAHCLRWAPSAAATEWIQSFARRESSVALRAAAELALLRLVLIPSDVAADELHRSFLGEARGTFARSEHLRLGLAHAASALAESAAVRHVTLGDWAILAAVPGPRHYAALIELFRHDGNSALPADALTRDVLKAIADAPAVLQGAQCDALAEHLARLISRDGWEAKLVGRVAMAVIERGQLWPEGHKAILDIVIHLQEHESHDLRKLGTQLLEDLLVRGVGAAHDLVEDLDRRIPRPDRRIAAP